MVRHVFSVVFGILAAGASLMAGPILSVAFDPPLGVNCSTTLTAGSGSETLHLGSCMGNGLVTFLGQPYATALAAPLEVAVNGSAGIESVSFEGALDVSASAQYEGSLEAVGGAGSAFLEFEIEGLGANLFYGDFSMPGDGINYEVDSFVQRNQFLVPVTFGDPVAYSLSVAQELYTWGEYDVMAGGVTIDSLEVVNANGVAIPGAGVISVEVGTVTVPEPGSAGMLAIGAGLLVLGGWLKRWSRERGRTRDLS